MQDLDHNEDRLRGTYDFPFEFHHIDQAHPRYVMSYHWHVEYEIIRILEGSLTVTLDEKSFIATAGDIIFVHSGIFPRCSSFVFPESTDKITQVIKTISVGNICYRVVCCGNFVAGLFDTLPVQIVHWSLVCHF